MAEPEPPFAEVKQVGWFTYRIVIRDGLSTCGPGFMGVVLGWRVWGRKRADRKARKVLAKYRAEQTREERWEREARKVTGP